MNQLDITMPQFLLLYFGALLVLGALDGAWLGYLARDFYRQEMGSLMADAPRLLPAAFFYVTYPIALVYFGLTPAAFAAAPSGPSVVLETFCKCAAFGMAAYGTYNLTALSVIKGFSGSLALVDTVWGTFATGVAGTTSLFAAVWWTNRG